MLYFYIIDTSKLTLVIGNTMTFTIYYVLCLQGNVKACPFHHFSLSHT